MSVMPHTLLMSILKQLVGLAWVKWPPLKRCGPYLLRSLTISMYRLLKGLFWVFFLLVFFHIVGWEGSWQLYPINPCVCPSVLNTNP